MSTTMQVCGFGAAAYQIMTSRQIEESISILNFFPPNPGVDFYFEFLPANPKIEESISILNVFPPN
jgi:hypothetical protein